MLIVDMPMPIVCDECPMLYDGMNCMATGTEVYPNRKERILKNGSVFDTSKNRFDDCPIKGELVRCKDCKWCDRFTEKDAQCKITGFLNGYDFYCADGERRSESDGK